MQHGTLSTPSRDVCPSQMEQAKLQEERAALEAMDPEAQAVHYAGIARADHLLEEQRDEVKRMNQMVLKGRCATEREAQVCSRPLVFSANLLPMSAVVCVMVVCIPTSVSVQPCHA